MLRLSGTIINKPVMSLRTGSPVAQVFAALINPDNLRIEGLYCTDRFSNETLILLKQDIRELVDKGYIINDHSVLSEPNDLIRLSDIINLNYQLIGKSVITISKDRVGKVSDYAVDVESMYIQKIYVSQTILKSFTNGNLSIDRLQVQEVTDKKIVINDLLNKNPVATPVVAI